MFYLVSGPKEFVRLEWYFSGRCRAKIINIWILVIRLTAGISATLINFSESHCSVSKIEIKNITLLLNLGQFPKSKLKFFHDGNEYSWKLASPLRRKYLARVSLVKSISFPTKPDKHASSSVQSENWQSCVNRHPRKPFFERRNKTWGLGEFIQDQTISRLGLDLS